MAESTEELQSRLKMAVAPGFRERLLDKGLARSLIWRDGILPTGSPSFPDSLTEDLLDYAHTVMAVALRLRTREADAPILERAFLVAGAIALCLASINIRERCRVNQDIEIHGSKFSAQIIQIRQVKLSVIEASNVVFLSILTHQRSTESPARAENYNFHQWQVICGQSPVVKTTEESRPTFIVAVGRLKDRQGGQPPNSAP